MARKRKIVRDLEHGFKQMLDILNGKAKPRRVYDFRFTDISDLRKTLGLSQAKFAARFGLNMRTVQDWEQGRVIPDQPARVLLKVIAASPKTVEKAVAKG
jgi:putative transcriptional regulator